MKKVIDALSQYVNQKGDELVEYQRDLESRHREYTRFLSEGDSPSEGGFDYLSFSVNWETE